MPTITNSYWAGFIAADGYVFGTHDERLGIELSSKDAGHLELFRNAIRFDGQIRNRDRTSTINGIATRSSTVTLQFTSHQVTRDLEYVFNITAQKSSTLAAPTLSHENENAFLVGYIDGNGYIGRTKEDYLAMSVCSGSAAFIEWVSSVVRQRTGEISTCKRKCYTVGKTTHLALSNKKAKTFLMSLNSSSVPCLARKWMHVR